jgi:hypothetical protein
MEMRFKYFRITFCLSFIVGLILSACTSSGSDEGLYCIDCKPEEPDSANISVKITINNENPKVPIVIFKSKFNRTGNLDTVYADTLSYSAFILKVKLNNFYSVKATYKSGSRKIHAIDGGWFDTKELTGCPKDCWQTVGGSYDLRLKE